jgi:biopolymer transport protein TolR
MVDVMLVLLVIFMVTAPLLTVGVPVDLPQISASALNDQDEPLTVTVNGQGIIYLQETPVELEVLGPRLVAITGSNPEARIHVKADKGLSYGRIMEVMGAINAAGFKKVALPVELPGTTPPTPQVKTDK